MAPVGGDKTRDRALPVGSPCVRLGALLGILLERVTRNRHASLPERLAAQIVDVVDDRQLDLELATYILSRRRALGPGRRRP